MVLERLIVEVYSVVELVELAQRVRSAGADLHNTAADIVDSFVGLA